MIKAAEEFRRVGRKHETLKALISHDQLQGIPSNSLWYGIEIACSWPLLEEGGVDPSKLSYTQHQALTAIKDPDQKLQLTKKAIAKKLNKKDFLALVAKTKGTSKRGRPPVPDFAKNLRSVLRSIEAAAEWKLLDAATMADQYQYYTQDEAQSLLSDLDTQLEKLQKARTQLVKQVKVIEVTAAPAE